MLLRWYVWCFLLEGRGGACRTYSIYCLQWTTGETLRPGDAYIRHWTSWNRWCLIRTSKDYVYSIWVYKALGIWKGYYRVKKSLVSYMKPWTEARNNKYMKYHSKLTYQLSFWNVSLDSPGALDKKKWLEMEKNSRKLNCFRKVAWRCLESKTDYSLSFSMMAFL